MASHELKDAQNEIARLEGLLSEANLRIEALEGTRDDTLVYRSRGEILERPIPMTPPHHYLLLLSDSALPLGSFAFSSGLESYLAHTRISPSTSTHSSIPKAATFPKFLHASLSSHASTNLPFTLAAHDNPDSLTLLDDMLDATIACTVARRASTAQGRALVSIWERSIAPTLSPEQNILTPYIKALKSPSSHDLKPWGHLAPLFGTIAQTLSLTRQQTAYVFLLGHVRSVISAAVRASLFGPFHAQGILAGRALQDMLVAAVDREWGTRVEDAGQRVPVLDLWVGRHELLYSRIFNS